MPVLSALGGPAKKPWPQALLRRSSHQRRVIGATSFLLGGFEKPKVFLGEPRMNSRVSLAFVQEGPVKYWKSPGLGSGPSRNNSVFSSITFGIVSVWLATHGSSSSNSAATKILTQDIAGCKIGDDKNPKVIPSWVSCRRLIQDRAAY